MREFELGSLLSRNPVFRNFLAASTISLVGSNIFDIAMPLYMIQRTHSATALALVTVGLTLPYFLMAPLTGYSADHLDNRLVMLVSDLGQVVCMLFLLAYVLSGCEAIWPIFIAIFAAKSMMILFETVSTFQLIPALVPSEDLPLANTWFLSAQRIIQIVGPMVGGIAMGFSGITLCILLNLMSFAATLYFVFRMKNLNALIKGERLGESNPPFTVAGIMENFTCSLRFIWHSPLFKPFIGFMFLWNLSALVPSSPTLTYYFTELKHFSSAEYGVVMSLFGFLGIAGFIGSGWLYNRFDFSRTFVGSCFWQALLASSCLLLFNFPFALATVFAISRAGTSLVTMGTFILRQTQIPKSQIGGVNACVRMFFMSAAPLSALFQAFLIDHFGVGVSLVLGAACLWGALWYARTVGSVYDGSSYQPMFSQDQAA